MRPSTEVRGATPDEMPRAIAAIVAAFLTDPIARFAWPSPHDHLRAMPLATREFASDSFEYGTAYVSADFCGGDRPSRLGRSLLGRSRGGLCACARGRDRLAHPSRDPRTGDPMFAVTSGSALWGFTGKVIAAWLCVTVPLH
jgi:hypothetical protein